MTKTELRRYCRESGINTRLSNRRIMLHQDDIARLIEWVRDRKNSKAEETGTEPDAFA